MKIRWLDGWDESRLLRRKYWGFKGTSSWTGRLRLGQTVRRQDEGPLVPCTASAVHVALDPRHAFVVRYNGDFSHPRSRFYVAVAEYNDRFRHKGSSGRLITQDVIRRFDNGEVGWNGSMFEKIVCTAYTIVAIVYLESGEQHPSRSEFINFLKDNQRRNVA